MNIFSRLAAAAALASMTLVGGAQAIAAPIMTINNFGGWGKAQATHLNDGGLFDQIFERAKR